MIKGRYYEDWNPGPYNAILWESSFIIELTDECGKIISTTDLSKMYSCPLIFTSSFKTEFDDYNNSELFISKSTGYYSTKLNKINGNTFETEYFDNSVPATFHNIYRWDGKQFVLEKNQKMTQEEGLSVLPTNCRNISQNTSIGCIFMGCFLF